MFGEDAGIERTRALNFWRLRRGGSPRESGAGVSRLPARDEVRVAKLKPEDGGVVGFHFDDDALLVAPVGRSEHEHVLAGGDRLLLYGSRPQRLAGLREDFAVRLHP